MLSWWETQFVTSLVFAMSNSKIVMCMPHAEIGVCLKLASALAAASDVFPVSRRKCCMFYGVWGFPDSERKHISVDMYFRVWQEIGATSDSSNLASEAG